MRLRAVAHTVAGHRTYGCRGLQGGCRVSRLELLCHAMLDACRRLAAKEQQDLRPRPRLALALALALTAALTAALATRARIHMEAHRCQRVAAACHGCCVLLQPCARRIPDRPE
eukprot:scaffold100447_cov34-Phaeocystis_antarctica.AAC.2